MTDRSIRRLASWALAITAATAIVGSAQTAQRLGRPAKPRQTQQQPAACPKCQSLDQIMKRVPAGVKYMPDLAYREGNAAWRLDLAMPEAGGPPRPGVVIVHGGGWTAGDKREGVWPEVPLEFAKRGYVAISVNYRLTPEWPMPACIEDVKCAVRWFRAHAVDYNLDPKRVGAFGYSAGAHLVAMLALSASDRTLEGDGPYKDQPSNVQAACVGGTPADFLNWGAERRSDTRATEIFGGPPEAVEQRATRFFPLSHVSAAAPPMLVIHGNADKAVPLSQAERLVKALRDAGAKKVVFIVFDGAGHGLFNGYSPIVLGTMAGFFDSSLGK